MAASQDGRAGFTLAETVVALAVMTVLLGGMASAVLIAGHALPDEEDLFEATAAAIDAAERVAGDLALADSITLADQNAIRFTVPDRGHGDIGPEAIEYMWSGTPGDALEQRYNGNRPVTACDDVREFSLEYVPKPGQLSGNPRVLLLVEGATTPSTDDVARRTEIESWGFPTDIIDPLATDEAYAAALAETDVMYWSEEHTVPPPMWVFDAPRGIVCEKRYSWPALGISALSSFVWTDTISIIDNTHDITAVFPAGTLQVCSFAQHLVYNCGDIAGGGSVLASAFGYDQLVAVDVGGALHAGGNAPARRVSLPWGDGVFDFTGLTDDGRTLMRRAIVWAAAPVVVGRVRITIQVGPDESGRVVSDVQLLNAPEAP